MRLNLTHWGSWDTVKTGLLLDACFSPFINSFSAVIWIYGEAFGLDDIRLVIIYILFIIINKAHLYEVFKD